MKTLLKVLGFLAIVVFAFLFGVGWCGYELSTNEAKARNVKVATARYFPDKVRLEKEPTCKKIPIGFR